MIVTKVQPDWRAIAATSRPTVPAPMTRAVEPGAGAARLRECIATESGSNSAAASKDMWSGSLDKLSAPAQSHESHPLTCDTKLQGD
jgi:hypothetical protein